MAHSQPPSSQSQTQSVLDAVPSTVSFLLQYCFVAAFIALCVGALVSLIDISLAAHLVPPWYLTG